MNNIFCAGLLLVLLGEQPPLPSGPSAQTWSCGRRCGQNPMKEPLHRKMSKTSGEPHGWLRHSTSADVLHHRMPIHAERFGNGVGRLTLSGPPGNLLAKFNC